MVKVSRVPWGVFGVRAKDLYLRINTGHFTAHNLGEYE